MRDSFVYIMTTRHNKVLYIGVTSNLQRRVEEHINQIRQGFTSKYQVHKLVYYERFDEIGEAIQREKYLKGKLRAKKIELISKSNPDWEELTPPCE